MAKVLFTWELGGGLGHVVPYLGIIEGLQRHGHQVTFALRDPTRASAFLLPRGVRCLQAPLRTRPVARAFAVPSTYADILYNCGFDRPDLLRGLVEAWRGLFELVEPDIVLFDHSPTALLAARAFYFVKVIVGTGFMVPPDVSPLPNLRSWEPADPAPLYAREQGVLTTINQALQELSLSPLERVTQLYTAVDLTVFHTFRELDHFPERVSGNYWGCAPQALGERPTWPVAAGKKLFAYLKPFPGLVEVLSALRSLGEPTIVYGDGFSSQLIQRFASTTLSFSVAPLDMCAAAAQCDAAIMNGTHSTAINVLLAGKPTLQLPITLEQLLFAQTLDRLNASITLRNIGQAAVAQSLKQLLADGSPYIAGARAFAARYPDWNAHGQENQLVDLLNGYMVQAAAASPSRVVRA